MRHVVHIAPLAALPAHASVFDYAWEGDIAPHVGMVVTIPFRSGEAFGLVTGLGSQSKFKLKTIQVTEAHWLLRPAEIVWLQTIAKTLKTGLGFLAQHALPPLSKRTIITLTRPNTLVQSAPGTLQYAWYSQHASIGPVLDKILATHQKPILIITATHDDAARLAAHLHASQTRPVHHLIAESAPKRRTIWLDWMNGSAPIVIGTHLAAWLPKRADTICILIEPTNPSHVQRDGAAYSNRALIESRRQHLGDNLIIVAHSPATQDLDRVKTIPLLAQWPTIVDRTTEDPKLRQQFVSPSLEQNIAAARNILFFVPHLREATHYVCKDCGSLYRAEDLSETSVCKKCSGTRFSKLGYGAQTVVDELELADLMTSSDSVHMLDAEKFKNVQSMTGEVPDIKKFTIATAPLFDRLALASFDLIVDLSVDFELIHPQYTTEEYLWQRLRATSSRLPADWPGEWFVQTRTPNLLGWRVRDVEGYTAWWNSEKELRKRFGQTPFSGG